MADHFLDTETRQDITHTALACVEAGLTVEDAHEVWLDEGTPVVGANMLSVAGEWAGWDADWLIAAVRKRALRRTRRGIRRSRFLDRFRLDLNRGVWRSIERCIRLLLASAPEQRRELAHDLALLARYYFGFARRSLPNSPAISSHGCARFDRPFSSCSNRLRSERKPARHPSGSTARSRLGRPGRYNSARAASG